MATKGGVREGAGRKSKAVEEQTNVLILSAIKKLKSFNTDEETKEFIISDLFSFERGKMFIAEHLFGKPIQTIDQNSNVNINNFDLKEVIKFDNTKQ